jgi:hypothetical protein
MQMLQLENRITRLETTLLEDRVRMQAEHEEQMSALREENNHLNRDLSQIRDTLNATSIELERRDEHLQASRVSSVTRRKIEPADTDWL